MVELTNLQLKILGILIERSPGEFQRKFFNEMINQTQPSNEWLLEAALQLLADDRYIEIRKARKTPYGWSQFESYQTGMELAPFIHGGGNFEIRVTPTGLRQYESLKQKVRSKLGSPLANAIVNEEGQEKQPMKSDGDNHTLADRGGAAYGDNASNNMAITGRVGRDIVFNVSPPIPPSSVYEHKAIKEYDAALQLKRAVLEVRNTISSVRNPNSDLDSQSKLNRIDEAVSALRAELCEAELHCGRGVWQTSNPLRLCALKLKQYIRRYTRQSEHLSSSDWEEINRIIWEDDPENDPFTLEIDESVDKILSFLDPYLNPSRN